MAISVGFSSVLVSQTQTLPKAVDGINIARRIMNFKFSELCVVKKVWRDFFDLVVLVTSYRIPQTPFFNVGAEYRPPGRGVHLATWGCILPTQSNSQHWRRGVGGTTAHQRVGISQNTMHNSLCNISSVHRWVALLLIKICFTKTKNIVAVPKRFTSNYTNFQHESF